MDSQDDIDIDALLDAELVKLAAEMEADPDSPNPYGNELEMIRQFQQNPTMETFEPLYQAHQPLINAASQKYSGGLPRAAVRGQALQRYTQALQGYDPNKGAQFKTHLFNEMRRLGRYKATYSNVARIGSEDRGGLINYFNQIAPDLRDRFGREPTNEEISDEMSLMAQDVAALQKKLSKIKDLPKMVGTLRKEMRRDLTLEEPSEFGETSLPGGSRYERIVTFLHGGASPEQQLIIEHTVPGFGKPIIEDDMQLARTLNMSPQKVRALKAQIRRKA
ncbi:MAG: hypothetical protein EPN91_07125, partial [Salinibacterium sp.]